MVSAKSLSRATAREAQPAHRHQNHRQVIMYLAQAYKTRRLSNLRPWRDNLNRWYDPAVGRWISEDPIGFAAGDSNLYRYVSNSPTNKTDPDGLEERDVNGSYDGPTIGAAPPWYRRWWNTFRGRLANRQPLISDPRGSSTFTIGDKTYVAPNYTGSEGMCYWVVGNFYHRTPLGGLGETGLRLVTSPIDESKAQLKDAGTFIVNIPNLPEIWDQLPDYQKQDIGINTLLGIGAMKLPYGQMSTLSKLQNRTMTRQQWQAFNQQQRAYQSGLQQLSRWGKPGLQNGAWAMRGGTSCTNYVLSGKWQPGLGNRFAPFSSGQSYFVPYEYTVWPSGNGIDGRWKGLFGQRIYVGPDVR